MGQDHTGRHRETNQTPSVPSTAELAALAQAKATHHKTPLLPKEGSRWTSVGSGQVLKAFTEKQQNPKTNKRPPVPASAKERCPFRRQPNTRDSPPYKGGVAAASADGVVLSSLLHQTPSAPSKREPPRRSGTPPSEGGESVDAGMSGCRLESSYGRTSRSFTAFLLCSYLNNPKLRKRITVIFRKFSRSKF
jgi:hypothetical protein